MAADVMRFDELVKAVGSEPTPQGRYKLAVVRAVSFLVLRMRDDQAIDAARRIMELYAQSDDPKLRRLLRRECYKSVPVVLADEWVCVLDDYREAYRALPAVDAEERQVAARQISQQVASRLQAKAG